MAYKNEDGDYDLLYYDMVDLMEKAASDTLLESRTIPEAETDVYPAVFQPDIHADRFQRLILEGATDIYKFVDIHAVDEDGLKFMDGESGEGAGDQGELQIRLKEDVFDINTVKLMDYTIEQALLHYFYSFWFAMIPQRPDIAPRYAEMYRELRTKAHRYTLHKKKATKVYRAY